MARGSRTIPGTLRRESSLQTTRRQKKIGVGTPSKAAQRRQRAAKHTVGGKQRVHYESIREICDERLGREHKG
jgi:hypothetical protein